MTTMMTALAASPVTAEIAAAATSISTSGLRKRRSSSTKGAGRCSASRRFGPWRASAAAASASLRPGSLIAAAPAWRVRASRPRAGPRPARPRARARRAARSGRAPRPPAHRSRRQARPACPPTTHHSAGFGRDSVSRMVRSRERLARISARLPNTIAAKPMRPRLGVAAAGAARPRRSPGPPRQRPTRPAGGSPPVATALNSGARGSRGGRSMEPSSLGSASKAIEQAGAITNSRNTTCSGNRKIGQPAASGSSDMPAIGTCTASR